MAKKIHFNSNDLTLWSELYFIEFEIDNTIHALKKHIEINENAFNTMCNDLEIKITNLRSENEYLNEYDLHNYIVNIHEVEERIIVDLKCLQHSSTVIYAFSIFENKLKMICEKIINEFDDFNKTTKEKKGSYVSYYWKILKSFLGAKINIVEKFFTPLKNQMILRNVITHQNNVIETNSQLNTLSQIKFIKTNEFQKTHYLVNIENEYLEDLTVLIESFFRELIKVLTSYTNDKLNNIV